MGQDKRRVAKIIGAAVAALAGCLLILAFGYLLGSSGGYYDAQADGYSQQIGKATDRQIEGCFRQPDPTAASPRECVEQAIRSAREEQRAEQDLSAQRQMAQWAWWLLLVTASQMPLTALGLYFLLRTIWQGQEANEAAKAQIAETKRLGEAQVRCYLSVTRAWMALHNGNVPLVTLVVQNSGQSPALNVSAKITLYWLDLKKPGLFEREIVGGSGHLFATIPAGPETQSLMYDLKDGFEPHEVEVLLSGDASISLAANVRLKWVDVFGIEAEYACGFVGATRQPEVENLFLLGSANDALTTISAERTHRGKRREGEEKK